MRADYAPDSIGAVLPSQFAEINRIPRERDPWQRLCLALLDSAIAEYRGAIPNAMSAGRITPRLKRAIAWHAEAWIFGLCADCDAPGGAESVCTEPRHRAPIPFESACAALGLDVAAMREGIARIGPEGEFVASREVLAYVRTRPDGATCHDVARAFDCSIETARARISHLHASGQIRAGMSRSALGRRALVAWEA